MRLAIIDDNDRVYVEYSTEVFRKLLIKYFEEFKDLDRAFEEVITQLRNLTLRK
jgi:hypothetical protein